jgi:hypothetical protein
MTQEWGAPPGKCVADCVSRIAPLGGCSACGLLASRVAKPDGCRRPTSSAALHRNAIRPNSTRRASTSCSLPWRARTPPREDTGAAIVIDEEMPDASVALLVDAGMAAAADVICDGRIKKPRGRRKAQRGRRYWHKPNPAWTRTCMGAKRKATSTRGLPSGYVCSMPEVASCELRNDTAGVLRRIREGEDVTITVNGRASAVHSQADHGLREDGACGRHNRHNRGSWAAPMSTTRAAGVLDTSVFIATELGGSPTRR